MKTLYNLLSIIAIANLLVIGGLVGFLIIGGKLNSQSATAIAAVLRGEKLIPPASVTTAPAASRPTTLRAQSTGQNTLATIEMQMAMLDREKRTLETDRYSRLKDAELKLIRDREALTRQLETFSQQKKVQRQASEDTGFNTALTNYCALPPKIAKEDFMKFDTDIVVRYLVNMPKRTSAKILQEFKTPAEQQKRQEIMERIRTQQVAADTTTQKAGG
ncbi:MAG: hypothetical protein WC975_10445 [Phycisphaerae bacterium]